MKIRFWGVRGSIASPGPHTVRYGGNTTCIEVRTDDNTLIVLDGGTGIFQLSQTLLKEMPLTAHVFITHTHWDHIQGLPFFIPIFVPGNTVRIHGAYDIVSGSGIEQVMNVQLQYSYFPVREAELKARIEYETLTVGAPFAVGDAVVSNVMLNHPVIDLGYRVDCNGKSVFFTGDHEPWYNIYDPADAEYAEYQRIIDEKQDAVVAAIRGVDVLIGDSSYTAAEYPAKRGWGHGTFDSTIALGRRAGAKKVICTHHEPTRFDDDLEKAFHEALARNPGGAGDAEVLLAREGMEIEL
ncbi:MAG: MBL fold metallo-hydrolase [Rhodocyclaceae bacterium]|nr:MBL fold metallo-hydrolase [Rhodocyclaceae bacterium]